MGKVKQVKHKKFDRNVEISAPILDPEIIKAIHTPQKGQRLDIRHGGFKALLSDLNSQDSVDELTPITENHVPSYIGISCAVSGYSNYSSYVKKPAENISSTTTATKSTNKVINRSQTNSPLNAFREHQVKHITIDKSNISADEERRKLTEELTASATERRPSPSPLPPIEDDRHHGAYVGARYFPMPPPSKIVNKHIPLLGIDDDQDPDDFVSDEGHKVEQKIATLYGDNFVEDWRESMSHKSKKEHPDEQTDEQKANALKSPKDLVALKPTPKSSESSPEPAQVVDVPTPNAKVLAGVEKQYLNKLLTDENLPIPKSPSPTPTTPTSPTMKNFIDTTTKMSHTESVRMNDDMVAPTKVSPSVAPIQQPAQQLSSSPVASEEHRSPIPPTPTQEEEQLLVSLEGTPNVDATRQASQPGVVEEPDRLLLVQDENEEHHPIDDKHLQEAIETTRDEIIDFNNSAPVSPSPPPMSPDSGKNQSFNGDAVMNGSQVGSHDAEEHIEYEIRASTPLDNQSSPVRAPTGEAVIGKLVDSGLVSGEKDPHLVDLSASEVSENLAVDNNANLEQLIDTNDVSDSDEIKSHADQHNQSAEPPVNQTTDLVQLLEETEVGGGVEELAKKLTESIIEESEEDRPNKDGDEHKRAGTVAANVSDNNSNGLYYLNLLDQEKSFISGQIEQAQGVLNERESELDEEAVGRLRSAIGKANLLINKKCNQFKELCERSIDKGKDEQYAVLNDDLAGFWDMLSIQIADVRKSFENLYIN